MSAASSAPAARLEPLHIADSFSLPLDAFAIPPQYAPYLSSVLLPHGMIMDRCDKLAQDIAAAYPAATPHFLVVLKGGNVRVCAPAPRRRRGEKLRGFQARFHRRAPTPRAPRRSLRAT